MLKLCYNKIDNKKLQLLKKKKQKSVNLNIYLNDKDEIILVFIASCNYIRV